MDHPLESTVPDDDQLQVASPRPIKITPIMRHKQLPTVSGIAPKKTTQQIAGNRVPIIGANVRRME